MPLSSRITSPIHFLINAACTDDAPVWINPSCTCILPKCCLELIRKESCQENPWILNSHSINDELWSLLYHLLCRIGLHTNRDVTNIFYFYVVVHKMFMTNVRLSNFLPWVTLKSYIITDIIRADIAGMSSTLCRRLWKNIYQAWSWLLTLDTDLCKHSICGLLKMHGTEQVSIKDTLFVNLLALLNLCIPGFCVNNGLILWALRRGLWPVVKLKKKDKKKRKG